MNRRARNLLFSVLMLVSMLACIWPKAATPTPLPTDTVTAMGQGTPTLSSPTSTVRPTVTNTPTPTPTPAPPTAPLLLRRQPDRGEELPVDAPLTLVFDQAMDKTSVEQAISIDPPVKGSLEWTSDRVLTFKPEKAWGREAVYRVAVGASAKSKQGLPLREELSFRFTTTGYLEVTQVQPIDKVAEVPINSPITIMFNRPVVAITAIADMKNLPQPLTLDPPVAGQGEWLNTSIYIWRPSQGLAPSTTYKVTVKAGLTDLTGGVLQNDYTWSFTTQMPAVVSTYPYDGHLFVGPTEVITVTFNQPMDPASVEKKFSLTYGKGTAVAGRFSWSENDTVFRFTPDAPLPRGNVFKAQVGQGATGKNGGQGLAQAYAWTFNSVLDPYVSEISPADGARDVNPYRGVTVRFSAPMDITTLRDNLTISYYDPGLDQSGSISITQVYSYWGNYETELYLSFAMRASSQIKIALGAGLKDKYGVPIRAAASSTFTTRQLDPLSYLAMPGNVGTMSAYTLTTILVGYRNVSRLDFELYQVSPSHFFQLIGSDSYRAWDKLSLGTMTKLHEWSLDVMPAKNQLVTRRLSVRDAGGNSLAPGLYLIQVKSPEISYEKRTPSRYLLAVSRTNLVVKRTRESALVWATDLQTGQPVPGVNVTLYVQSSEIGSGTTNAEGIFSATFSSWDMWSPIMVLARAGDDVAVNSTYWSEGISPWEYNISAEYYQEPIRSLIYTDRPIYRPGQTVYFKGIIRLDHDAQYALPNAPKNVYVTIQDSQGREVYAKELPLSDMGTFDGELTLAAEADLGYYSITGMYNEYYLGDSFRVAEYKKPEYQIEVQTDQPQYVQSDTVRVTALATYYFGGPVAGAKVRWAVLTQDYYFRWDGPGSYDWREWEWRGYGSDQYYYGGYGELIAEGTGETDEEGRFTFAVPADIANKINSQVLTLEVTVTDVNNQEVSNRTETIVHKGLFYVGLAPRRYVGKVGEEQIVDVKIVDLEQQPVSNQEATVVFMRENWYSTEKLGSDGRYYWDWEVQEIPVLTTTIKTNAKGEAEARFTPQEGGSFKVRAIATDKLGNKVRSATYLWVSSGKWISWRRDNNDRIELIADKKEYKVGEAASIMVPSPFRGPVKALVTIERGELLEHFVTVLETNSDVLSIPILESYVPNVFVSVVIVKGVDDSNSLPAFKMGYVALPVSTGTKTLNITIKPDRDMKANEHYGPGDTVKYDILVTDHRGQGIETELSLDVVDLAVLALTGGERGQSLLDVFYRQRGVGIQTSSSLIVSLDRVAAVLPVQDEKGGGGGLASESLVRTNFQDTAYWRARVRTDASGRASVEVTLPDNLTTWRMRARGITADTLVGEGTADVLSTLDVLARPVTPRFFVIGDKATLSIVAHNNTVNDLDAVVTLQAAGLDIAQGPQTVRIPAGGKVKVDWQVTVPNVEQVVLRGSVKAGDYADAIEITLPVYTYSTPEVVATAGQIANPEERMEAVILPQKLDPTQGELTIQVEPSLAAGMRDGLKYLEHYEYECTEQTISRWLPNVLTYQALKSLGIENPELAEKLPGLVSEGLQKIYAQQHYDGGWGWWPQNKSNPFVSAYVLLGLIKTQAAGLTVDEQVITNAIQFVKGQLLSPQATKVDYERNQQAFLLYVLAEAGAGDLGRSVRLASDRDKLSYYGRAYLAMALGLFESPDSERIKALLSDLTGAAIVSATGAHWEEKQVDYWTMNTDTRSTAVIIDALTKLDPQNALLPNAVRWLMVARKAGHWETTQETAWALMALTDYMLMTGELQADYSYEVSLNDQDLDRQQITPAQVGQSFRVIVPIADLLAQEVNRVWITRQQPAAGQTGKGQLYYAMYLRYFVPVEDVRALGRGIIVARQYQPIDCEKDKNCPHIDHAQVGDVIKVKITLVAPHDLHYLVVEDPLPAGCEAIDRSLKTTSVVSEDPTLRSGDPEYGWDSYGWGWWWFSHSDVRDEKVALFADFLPRGTYEYTYYIRASVPGEFLTMPTLAYEMYFPEVWGRSDGGKMIISAE